MPKARRQLAVDLSVPGLLPRRRQVPHRQSRRWLPASHLANGSLFGEGLSRPHRRVCRLAHLAAIQPGREGLRRYVIVGIEDDDDGIRREVGGMASHSDKDTPPLIGRTLRRLNTYVLRLPEVEDASPSLCRSYTALATGGSDERRLSVLSPRERQCQAQRRFGPNVTAL